MIRHKHFRAAAGLAAALGLGLLATQGVASASSGQPTVNEVIPGHGPAAGGTSVKIFGHNLNGSTAVDFGKVAATSMKVVSNEVVDAVSPAGSGTVNVRVITPSGESAANPRYDSFTYLRPVVNEVAPSHGPAVGGTKVQIVGHNLSGATTVDFGSVPATSVTVISADKVTAISPAGTGTVNVRVTTPSGKSAANPPHDGFVYIRPVVNEVIPDHGPSTGGTSVRIIGHDLKGATAVDFGPTPASSFTVVSDAIVDAVSPVGTGTVNVRITTPSGESAIRAPLDHFSYDRALPSVVEVLPTHGPAAGGTSVRIFGHNLNGTTAVDFGATAATSVTVVSNTVVTAVSPAGTGTVNVRVTTPSGESAAHPALDDFTYQP